MLMTHFLMLKMFPCLASGIRITLRSSMETSGSACIASVFLKKKQNATKALAHAAKIRGKDIAICKGQIPVGLLTTYRCLQDLRVAVNVKKHRN